MEFIESLKHYLGRHYPLVKDKYIPLVRKYYPRRYLYSAVGLFVLLLAVLFFPNDNGNVSAELAVATQAEPQLPTTAPAAFVGADTATPSRAARRGQTSPAEEISLRPNPQSLMREAPAETADVQIPLLEAVIAEAEPAVEPAMGDSWQEVTVAAGDNLSSLFRQVGLTDQDLFKLINGSSNARILNRLFPGYQLSFNITDANDLIQLRILSSPDTGNLFTLNENNDYTVTSLQQPAPEPVLATATDATQVAQTEIVPPASSEVEVVLNERDAEILAGNWQSVEVVRGDNPSSVFRKVGLRYRDVLRVVNSGNAQARAINRLFPGDVLSFDIPDDGELRQLHILDRDSKGKLLSVTANDDYRIRDVSGDADLVAGVPGTTGAAAVIAPPPAPLEVISTVANTLDSNWQNIQVQAGDNLSAIFTQVGLSNQDLFRVLNSSEEASILNRVYPGYQLNFRIPESGELAQLQVLQSPLQGYQFTLVNSDYQVQSIQNNPDIATTFKQGTIADSLFLAGQEEKIPANTIMEMANLFTGVIDFVLDPRPGDEFSILYEEKYLNGQYIGEGEVLATQFINDGVRYIALRYVNEEGDVGYYNPGGESMRKAFLRNPMDVFRISSNFAPRRRHPVLNTIRAHKGTDYAAPTGTPIMATADGRVTWAARNGSFGKLVVIKHSGAFETKYAHLSNYANGIRQGTRVEQGDIIGYVGSTGSATGPHLHYEFLIDGVHKNPRTVHNQLPKAESLNPSELDRFRSETADLLEYFEGLNEPRLLSINPGSSD